MLAFDRESGAVLERLYLRPELAAFESPIRRAVEKLAAFEDERFARPSAVERDADSGELSVLSEFIAGSRLSDLLEAAEEAGLVPGVDVALGFLLEALPGLSGFHAATATVHGLIDPTRLVITPVGEVIFLDAAYGPFIERLALSRLRLWSEFGLASPSGAGPVSLDVAADLAQLALSAVTLVIGRRLKPGEYPDGLSSLVMEVVEVAQIRGSSTFATSLQRLLQRTLPLPGRRPYRSADELANEIRLLLRREIGPDLCRQALVEFAQQMDRAFASARGDAGVPTGAEPAFDTTGREALFGLDDAVLDTLESLEVLDAGDAEPDDEDARAEAAAAEDITAEESEQFEEIPLDAVLGLDAEPPSDIAPVESESAATAWRGAEPAFEQARLEPDPPSGSETVSAAGEADPPPAEEGAESEASYDTYLTNASRRKKRQKSARARKDRLRSATAPAVQKTEPEKPKPSQTGWLVSPDRAAAFAPPVAEPPPAAPPAGTVPAPQAPMPAIAAPPQPIVSAPTPMSVAPVLGPPAAIPMPSFARAPAPPPPPAPVAAPAAAPAPPRPAIKLASAGAPVKLKDTPPPGYKRPQAHPAPMNPYAERAPMFQTAAPAPSRFPWKLAAAAVLVVGIAAAVGRAYLPSRTAPSLENTAPAAAPSSAGPAAAPPPAVTAPAGAAIGSIEIETQPAGARVLLDGRPVGESPLKLPAVPAGRHTLTFISSSGEVTRSVRVTAGRTTTVDVPIFSGWVAVFAPVMLEIAVNGQSLGTTEQDRLMLPPGKHQLTLTNRDLGYTATQQVEIEPGEVRSITVEPKGQVNFNAVPWAEVWLDGRKLGDTPLANQRVALGTREFVFKHPQYGERRVSAVVRGDQAAAVSVDLTRPQ